MHGLSRYNSTTIKVDRENFTLLLKTKRDQKLKNRPFVGFFFLLQIPRDRYPNVKQDSLPTTSTTKFGVNVSLSLWTMLMLGKSLRLESTESYATRVVSSMWRKLRISELRIRILCFFDPWIRDGEKIRIRDEHPRLFFRELRNSF